MEHSVLDSVRAPTGKQCRIRLKDDKLLPTNIVCGGGGGAVAWHSTSPEAPVPCGSTRQARDAPLLHLGHALWVHIEYTDLPLPYGPIGRHNGAFGARAGGGKGHTKRQVLGAFRLQTLGNLSDRVQVLWERGRGRRAWCGAVWCGVVWCAEGAVTRRQWPGRLPTGTGKWEGCVYSVRSVRKCVDISGKSRGDMEVTHQATAISLEAPAALPLSPPVGAGAAPATPTPSCCLGPGGPSATWHAPWRGRTL